MVLEEVLELELFLGELQPGAVASGSLVVTVRLPCNATTNRCFYITVCVHGCLHETQYVNY